MSAAATLLPVALVGTARQHAPPQAPAGPVGELMQAIAAVSATPAEQLLRQAGVLAVCALAAAHGTQAPHAGESAPADARPAMAHPDATTTLRWLLQTQDAPQRVLIEALQRLHHLGWLLPPTLLPLALEAGRRSAALRPTITAALGERGRWLARQMPDARYAVGSAESGSDQRWSEGNLAQRVAWLTETRQQDPVAARDHLAAALPELPAAERATLLAVLAQGLSADDEGLLTSLLQDRSREVRQTALALLVALPDGAHARRATQRMAALMRAPGGLRLFGKGIKGWSLDAPGAAEPDWKVDGVDAVRPKNESLGERAWWLYQVARQVPLAWWTAHTDGAPDALLHWASKGDWAEALARAWYEVLLATAAARPAAMASTDSVQVWAEAFLAHGSFAERWLADIKGPMLALLPRAAREPHWTEPLAKARTQPALLAHVLSQIQAAFAPGETVSEPLGRALLDCLRTLLAGKHLHQAYGVRAAIIELPGVLPPALLPEVATLPRAEDETSSLAETLNTTLQVAHSRAALLAWPAAPAPRSVPSKSLPP